MSFQAYFISDLHLKNQDEANTKVLARFLRELLKSEKATHLFLVGDIFDMWVSDHSYFIEKFSLIVELLDSLVQKGLQVHYFEGNHDLHLERFWQRKLSVKVHSGPTYFEIGDFTIRVEHGDLINKEDRGYLFLKSVLNNRPMKWFADHAPGRMISAIGESASRKSRDYTSNAKAISEEETKKMIQEHALREYESKPFDFIITGHVHVRDDFAFDVKIDGPVSENSTELRLSKSVRSINLGTWLNEPSVFIMTPTRQEFQMLV